MLVEDTRLGIPAIVHEESVGGFCARDATVFPQAIGLAATWDPALVEAVAGVIREQMLAGVLGTAYVRGLQTDDLAGVVVCTPRATPRAAPRCSTAAPAARCPPATPS